MDKICDKCGCKNPYSALYCRFCGNKFGNKEGEVIASLEISEQDVIDESRSLKLAHESEITSLKEQIQLIKNENASLLNRYNFIKKVNSANEFELSKLRGYKSDEEHVVNELKSSNDSLSKENSDLKTAIATILLLVFSVGSIILFTCIKANSNKDDNDDKSNDVSELLSKISENTPFFVASIEVRNAEGQYNETIRSEETTYINPKIQLISLKEDTIDLNIKFYTPDGLSIGEPSMKVSEGFSYGDRVAVKKNDMDFYELSGWGNDEKGHWQPGQYKIEVFYKDKCLASKEFSIVE